VPSTKLTIFGLNNEPVLMEAGPFNEDEPANLTCVSDGGKLIVLL
jgi:hypothetical protein